MTVVIMGIILGMLMLFVFIAQLAGPLLFGSVGDLGNTIKQGVENSGNPNLIAAQNSSIEPAIQGSVNNFEWITYSVLIVMLLGFIIMCFYVRTYPFLIFVWIAMIVILLLVSLILAYSYQETAASSVSGYYDAWENSDFLLKHLPVIILMTGLIGGIIMFVVASREEEIGGGSYPI